MLSKAIFYDKNNHYSDYSLRNEIEKILAGLNKCLASTMRVADKSPSPNFQEGSACLSDLCSKIHEKGSELMFKQTLHCR